MQIDSTQKLAKHIFRLLKVNEIVFPIGRTDKGNLGIKFSTYHEGFEIMLDAVPLSIKDILQDDNNIELKRILEKYWFEDSTRPLELAHVNMTSSLEPLTVVVDPPKNKGGRPKGSKNKKNGNPTSKEIS